MCETSLIVILSGLAFVISLIAIVRSQHTRDLIRFQNTQDLIKKQNDRLSRLEQEVNHLKESPELTSEKVISAPSEIAPEKPPVFMKEEAPVREIPVPAPVEIPVVPSAEEVPEVADAAPAEALPAEVEPKLLDVSVPSVVKEPPPHQPVKPLIARIDREQWVKLEEKLGKQWMTWVGAVVLFLSAGFFVKYAFEHGWLTEWGRVILGVIAGIVVIILGERFLRRKMISLGQGLVGTGLAILYVSLYAAYGFYELLPQPIIFILMVLIVACGMVLAVIHDAIAISFLALHRFYALP